MTLRQTIYLKLVPSWRRTVPPTITGFTVGAVTKNPPRHSDGPVLTLNIEVPEKAFEPFRPEVTVSVPEDALDYTPAVHIEIDGYDDAPEDDDGF